MGMYGQVPAAFNPSGPEGGAPPGYGWFWGMMGGPGAAGVPAGPPAQGQRAAAGTFKPLTFQEGTSPPHSHYCESSAARPGLPLCKASISLSSHFWCSMECRTEHCRLVLTRLVCFVGQPVPTTGPQGTPHAPSLARAGAGDRQSEPMPDPAVPSQGGTVLVSPAHGADPGEAQHKAALPEEVHHRSHGLHAVQDHSSAAHHLRPTLQGGSQAEVLGTPAGQTAHALSLPAHTSATPSMQAHAVFPHMRPPDQGGTALPAVPSGAAPEGRPNHRAEQLAGVPGQAGQHTHQTAGLGTTQEAPSDAQLEATQKPPPHEVK